MLIDLCTGKQSKYKRHFCMNCFQCFWKIILSLLRNQWQTSYNYHVQLTEHHTKLKFPFWIYADIIFKLKKFTKIKEMILMNHTLMNARIALLVVTDVN